METVVPPQPPISSMVDTIAIPNDDLIKGEVLSAEVAEEVTVPKSSPSRKRTRTEKIPPKTKSASTGTRKPRKSSKMPSSSSSLVDEMSTTRKSTIKTTLQQPSVVVSTTPSTPPRYVLVLDNGSDTIKYGWSIDPQQQEQPINPQPINYPDNDSPTEQNTGTIPTIPITTSRCHYMPNITARLTQQYTILIGNDIMTQVKNPNVSCTALTRSCNERGMMTNMGNQIQVWKHILDTLHVTMTPSTFHSETAMAFGWNKGLSKMNQQQQQLNNHTTVTTTATVSIPSNQCGVMIGLPPYTPRSIIEQIMTIWYDEFQFQHVGFCVSSAAAATSTVPVMVPAAAPEFHQTTIGALSQSSNIIMNDTGHTSDGIVKQDTSSDVVPALRIACVVDFGYSAIHVIPVYENKVILAKTTTKSTNTGTTIRRIPFGGKHMINLLKYYSSYRQWNLMDSEWIVRDVFEKTAFVSTTFLSDMKLAQKIPYFGKRPYDREYILPNYDTTFIGQVQIPESVQIEIERMEQLHQNEAFHNTVTLNDDDKKSDDEDEDDEDYNENDMNVDDIDDDNDDDSDDGMKDDEDDENESPEQIRQRLLKQREDERRLREMEAEQHQILNVSTERFAIPEALFRPSDVGLPTHWANVPQAIVQSIEACPPIYRPGLYQSIQLTGGLSQLPNLKDRLFVELRAIVPCQYPLKITINDSPKDQAWNGIANITRQESYKLWSVSRDEWEVASRRGAWKRLRISKGGHLI